MRKMLKNKRERKYLNVIVSDAKKRKYLKSLKFFFLLSHIEEGKQQNDFIFMYAQNKRETTEKMFLRHIKVDTIPINLQKETREK